MQSETSFKNRWAFRRSLKAKPHLVSGVQVERLLQHPRRAPCLQAHDLESRNAEEASCNGWRFRDSIDLQEEHLRRKGERRRAQDTSERPGQRPWDEDWALRQDTPARGAQVRGRSRERKADTYAVYPGQLACAIIEGQWVAGDICKLDSIIWCRQKLL